MTRFLSAFLFSVALSSVAVAGGNVDAGHSGVMFKAKHFDAGYTWGRFNEFEGNVEMDGSFGLTSLNITVKAESVDTNIDKRDKHLRSPDFFETDSFPEMTFVSTSVQQKSDGVYTVTGNLTLHGVTKPYTVELTRTGVGDLPVFAGGGKAVGWETTFPVSMADHGIVYDGVGDVVHILVNLEVKA